MSKINPKHYQGLPGSLLRDLREGYIDIFDALEAAPYAIASENNLASIRLYHGKKKNQRNIKKSS